MLSECFKQHLHEHEFFIWGGGEGVLSPQILWPLLSEFSGSAPEIRVH